jgi:hypothetical protein
MTTRKAKARAKKEQIPFGNDNNVGICWRLVGHPAK